MVHATKGQRSSGYSLIEVLVSLLVFSILAFSISAGITRALQASSISDNLTQATFLAQEKLEERAAGFGPRSGSDSPRPGFSREWTTTASAPPSRTARVTVAVSWTAAEQRTISLATLLNE